MPKARTRVKGTKQIVNGKAKFKLGGRKTSKGGHGLTTAELVNVFFKEDAGKSRSKAIGVLRARGVNVNTLERPVEA